MRCTANLQTFASKTHSLTIGKTIRMRQPGFCLHAIALESELMRSADPPSVNGSSRGYARHTGNHPIKYGMGKMGVDGTTGNIIAECRALPSLNINGFNSFARAVFGIASEFMLAGQRTWQEHPFPGNGWGPTPPLAEAPGPEFIANQP